MAKVGAKCQRLPKWSLRQGCSEKRLAKPRPGDREFVVSTTSWLSRPSGKSASRRCFAETQARHPGFPSGRSGQTTARYRFALKIKLQTSFFSFFDYFFASRQFFDTLALYFCLASEDDRPPAGEPVEFQKVPLGPSGKCATVKVAHLSEGRYSISPFPFAESPLQVELAGTLVRPDSETHANTQELLTKGVEHVERFVLVRDD